MFICFNFSPQKPPLCNPSNICNTFLVADKPKPVKKDVPQELLPANLVELENQCSQLAIKAVSAYSAAKKAVQVYNTEVISLVERPGAQVDDRIWNK